MRLKFLLLLVAAAGVGFATVQFARQWLSDQKQQAAAVRPAPTVAEPASVFVLVADDALPVGHFIKESDLRWQAWPDVSVPDSYVEQGEREIDGLVGAVVRGSLGPGEPITDQRLVMPGDRGFLAAVLQPGMRASSVPIDEARGLAGLVFPGDRVDILLTHVIDQPSGHGTVPVRASETVLTDIRVLAIDQNISDDAQEPKVGDTVTLEVTPRQAEELRVVLSLGSLSLSLRSLADPQIEADDADRAMQVAGVPDAEKRAKPIVGQDDAALIAAAMAEPHTYTLDSDVSALLRPVFPSSPEPAAEPVAAPPQAAPAEPVVTVFRGSAVR